MIPPAKTGRASNNSIAVIKMDHTNKGIFRRLMIETLIFKMVTMKLIAPNIEDIPARCKAIITMSTDGPEWASPLDSGG